MEESLGKVRTLYTYSAQNEDELSFECDVILDILDRSDNIWWLAEKTNGETGLVPCNYIDEIISLKQLHQQNSTIQQTSTIDSPVNGYHDDVFTSDYADPAELFFGGHGNKVNGNEVCLFNVWTKYQYAAINHDELSFDKNVILEILEKPKEYPDWWIARNKEGDTGLIPSNYVEEIATPIISPTKPNIPEDLSFNGTNTGSIVPEEITVTSQEQSPINGTADNVTNSTPEHPPINGTIDFVNYETIEVTTSITSPSKAKIPEHSPINGTAETGNLEAKTISTTVTSPSKTIILDQSLINRTTDKDMVTNGSMEIPSPVSPVKANIPEPPPFNGNVDTVDHASDNVGSQIKKSDFIQEQPKEAPRVRAITITSTRKSTSEKEKGLKDPKTSPLIHTDENKPTEILHSISSPSKINGIPEKHETTSSNNYTKPHLDNSHSTKNYSGTTNKQSVGSPHTNGPKSQPGTPKEYSRSHTRTPSNHSANFSNYSGTHQEYSGTPKEDSGTHNNHTRTPSNHSDTTPNYSGTTRASATSDKIKERNSSHSGYEQNPGKALDSKNSNSRGHSRKHGYEQQTCEVYYEPPTPVHLTLPDAKTKGHLTNGEPTNSNRQLSKANMQLGNTNAQLSNPDTQLRKSHQYSNREHQPRQVVVQSNTLQHLKQQRRQQMQQHKDYQQYQKQQQHQQQQLGTVVNGKTSPYAALYTNEQWYHGQLSRGECEKFFLSNAAAGEFLVRESESTPGTLSLSVKTFNGIKHYKITRNGPKYVMGHSYFRTMDELVRTFSTKIPICTDQSERGLYLSKPVDKYKFRNGR